jgi:Fe2+ or Zn2+ uptake regulation protein
MSSVASVVQYPLPCPECKNYTSQPAETLRKDRKSTCRVCGSTIRLTDQQLESLERTLSHMSGCGLRKDEIELATEESEEEAV